MLKDAVETRSKLCAVYQMFEQVIPRQVPKLSYAQTQCSRAVSLSRTRVIQLRTLIQGRGVLSGPLILSVGNVQSLMT
jgi:hypothetical protein